MKFFFTFFILTVTTMVSIAQTTVTLKPGAAAGKDARLWDINPSMNYGTEPDFIAAAWTWGGSSGLLRSLIQFDLSAIPANSTIVSANLSLFYNSTSTSAGQAGANASYLQRVTSTWDESSVTWNNQPSTTSANQILLAQSSATNQSYPNINVSAIVQDWINNPSTNYGFLLKLQNEVQMVSMKFCSSDAADSTKWPALEITYIPSDINCLILQPDDEDGKDAEVWSNNPSNNYGNVTDFIAAEWTWGGTEGTLRSLVEFDLSGVPANATIDSATLSLYWNSVTTSAGQAGTNATFLQRITSSWTETGVTWNNQPTTTSQNQVSLATSSSSTQDYPNIDVKNLVIDMLNNPTSSFGFEIKLQTEAVMRSMKFCSSDFATPAMRPRLKICYTINEAAATISNTQSPLLFPNPFVNEINVGGAFANSIHTMELFDIYGRKILAANSGEKKLNTSDLPSGIYFLKLINSDKKYFEKIIKL